jgi:hypothetical protein
MAEVLVTFNDPISGADGTVYRARACGREMSDGRWEGWIEFEALDGSAVLRSGRETTQPNRTDTEYWATGLTAVYLEGALERALHPANPPAPLVEERPAFDGPRPATGDESPLHNESVLNPFSVYRKGEALLRRQLAALASWHLVNIIEAHELSDQSPVELNRLTSDELIELIVATVRQQSAEIVER